MHRRVAPVTSVGDVIQPGQPIPAAPEPQQADASPVLDLVRQYGEESYQQGIAAGQRDEGSEDHYDDKARALFARISALVPQQPAQARGSDGELLWIHGCSKVMAWPRPPQDWTCDNDTSPWRPLLVGGDSAPENGILAHARKALHERDAARAELERVHAEHDEAVTDRESARGALRRVAAERDEARTRMLEHLGEADEARAEVERYQRLLKSQASNFAAAQPDPLVLSLPEVHPLIVAAVGIDSERRYTRVGHLWRREFGEGGLALLVEMLDEEKPDGVRVELAPPREPRTWPKLDGPPKDLPSVRGASGIVYRRWADNSAYYFPPPGPQRRAVFGDAKLLSHWREVDGPLTEVTE